MLLRPLEMQIHAEIINRPEWMIIKVVPVIPPESHGLWYHLDGGTFCYI